VSEATATLARDATVEYDPFSYEQDLDPYPVYRWMRDYAPVYRNDRLDFYAFTRYADVQAALLDAATYISSFGTSLEFMDSPKSDIGLMIYMDPPRHTRYRKLVSKVFTAGRIRQLEPLVRAIANRHLDALVGRPRVDAVREFTARLPMDVISTILGIPAADRSEVQRKSNLMLHREPGNPMPTQEAIAASLELTSYWTDLLAERRRSPQEDLLSQLAEVEVDDDDGVRQRLSDDDIRGFLVLLATAGNETVTKLLATIFFELWRNPAERGRLVADPALIGNAVEETLRFDPPSQYQGRVTSRDVVLHGTTMPAGAKVLLINGATGRDERVFPEPDRYDVRRTIDGHLGFGFGRHLCIGAWLARMESRIGVEEFLRRWPRYEIPADGVERMHSSNVRGLAGLVIEAA
jgi:cytochrome P450